MRVKAIVDCFVEGTLRQQGEQFEYTGPKNENLQPVKAEKNDPANLSEDEKEK